MDNISFQRIYKMPKYVDGFILVVPKAKDYRKMAEMGRDSWIKHGALAYFEGAFKNEWVG